MRLEIYAEDRIGISQDILAYFTQANCNLIAIEVIKYHMYINIDSATLSFAQVKAALLAIPDVKTVDQIELLPAELRQKHLNALMQRLPDPIFDIRHDGVISVASASAAAICQQSIEQLEGQNLSTFIDQPISILLGSEYSTIEVNVLNQPFLVDITPVINHGKVAGAILILRSPQRIGQQLSALKQTSDADLNQIIGCSPLLKAIIAKTARFGKLDLPVLIRGETGTGKELLARALHQQGCATDAPFLAINCATLAENLLESELFGYAPGAFSGAQRGGKPGLFELAAGGSVFLDEIGEMSTYLQAKLLRFLQDFTFRRVGGNQEITVKVRIISATHRNLEMMAQQGSFREDLFYRLNVLNLEIPPLRERADDIPLLVDHFVTRAATQIALAKPQVSAQALSMLCQYPWPGNIRQLENLLFRSVALLDGDTLNASDIQLPATPHPLQTSQPIIDEQTDWQSAQLNFEKALLTQLYPRYPSTRKLANRLKVSHNKIAMKLKQHGLNSYK